MYIHFYALVVHVYIIHIHTYLLDRLKSLLLFLERFLKNTHYSLNSLPFLLFNTQNYHTSFRHDFLMEGKTKTQKKITMTSSLPCTFDI